MASTVKGEILDRLSCGSGTDGRIFYIEKEDDGTFTITEACDNYFSIELSPDDLKKLGHELIAATKS